MGTRGLLGLVIDGQEKLTYNHFDSYPSYLGIAVLKDLRSLLAPIDDLRERARRIMLVNEGDVPTAEQIATLAPYTNLTVSSGSTDDWYCVLRDAQGSIAAYLDAGVMIDNHEFAFDSLFCEWGYVVDLDAVRLDVYRGFQKAAPTEGRWAGRPTAEESTKDYAEHLKWCEENGRQPWMTETPEYFAIARVASWPLGDGLPDESEMLALEGIADEQD